MVNISYIDGMGAFFHTTLIKIDLSIIQLLSRQCAELTAQRKLRLVDHDFGFLKIVWLNRNPEKLFETQKLDLK